MKNAFHLLIVILLAGCHTTLLEPKEILPRTVELSSLNSPILGLYTVTEVPKDSTLGHQFVLFFFPLGRIQHKSLESSIYGAAFEKLAIKGYRVVSAANRSLKLRILGVSLSGFDFVFFRRLVCELAIEATILENGVVLRSFTTEVTESDVSAKAFAPQLTGILESATSKAVDDLLLKLGL